MSLAHTEPVLAMNSIQGDILEGFNKPFVRILYGKIQDVPRTKQWLQTLLPHLTTAAEVHSYRNQRRNSQEKSENASARPVAWLNVAFSWHGLNRLVDGLEPQAFSTAFVDGQWKRAQSILGDPLSGPGSPGEWKIGGSDDKTPDIVLLCAADRESDLTKLEECLQVDRGAIELIGKDNGTDLGEFDSRLRKREHFGFRDGISRPGIRGRVSEEAFLCPRTPHVPQNPTLPQFASPGRPLIWPGQFVLGYETQSPVNARASMPALSLRYPWLKDGSYLVFRRLEQDVYAFRHFVQAETRRLQQTRAFNNLTQERFAALLVGRWPNGVPLSLSPDYPSLDIPQESLNDFLFLGTPDGWKNTCPDDVLGERCPVSAHIRKVNPRDQGTDLGPAAENLRRVLLRRGIPYGKPFDDKDSSSDEERGLLFLSYQASIEDTFETIIQSWMNSSAGPTPPSSFDMLVGRNPRSGQRRFASLMGDSREERIETSTSFIYATGGGYFFSPSISAIQSVLAV